MSDRHGPAPTIRADALSRPHLVIDRRRPALQAASLLALVVALAGCAAASPSSSVAPPTAGPTAAGPTPGNTAQSGFHVELTLATDNDVTVDVVDDSSNLVEASSGTPGDGASVEPYTLRVSNDDPTTLRLTWVGGPCDSANTLEIDPSGRRFVLVQPECAGDAVAHDRILILEFAEPIAAVDVEAFLQDGLDTPG
jgi:hypothetical protein